MINSIPNKANIAICYRKRNKVKRLIEVLFFIIITPFFKEVKMLQTKLLRQKTRKNDKSQGLFDLGFCVDKRISRFKSVQLSFWHPVVNSCVGKDIFAKSAQGSSSSFLQHTLSGTAYSLAAIISCASRSTRMTEKKPSVT